jgi:hypothetical protein
MDISGIASSSGLHAISGASNGAPPQQKMSNLFDSIDTSGSGTITQSQFEQAFQTKNPPAVDDDGLPNARPIALSDSPRRQRSHNSVFSVAVNPRRNP